MTEEKSFEKAFNRLEEILQKMTEEKVSLDISLNLFSEADSLIKQCTKNLVEAEQKIETLIKNRENLEIENGTPKTQDFQSNRQRVLDN